jgi:hypothetical protein
MTDWKALVLSVIWAAWGMGICCVVFVIGDVIGAIILSVFGGIIALVATEVVLVGK